MSIIRVPVDDTGDWTCAACNEPLRPLPVELEYLESHFSVELPACPKCGMALVPESLALGKMAEVERLLEDK